MAELPDLGKHCNVENCKQLDFLPFTCDGCAKIYCSDHRTKDSHDCSKEHVETSCCEYTGARGYTCTLEGCTNRELTPIICDKCQHSFCLSHRHSQDHNCPKNDKLNNTSHISKTAQHVNQILASKQASGGNKKKVRGSKSSKTAAKVALMKMKLHSAGDKGCPDEDRVYLRVALPCKCDKKPAQLYFSKTWSVGRMIDSIADRVGLTNNNNVTKAQKLRVFSSEDGCIFATDSDLDTLLKQELLFNGSNIILEYVDNNCDQLEDISVYKL